jgi:cobyrinic acid a,c-diamide synthase
METVDGTRHAMAGILPATAKMHRGLQALAYVDVTLKEDALWGHAGESVRGHEFHHSTLTANPAGAEGWRSVYRMRKLRVEAPVEEGFQKGNILASYAHLHLASRRGRSSASSRPAKGQRPAVRKEGETAPRSRPWKVDRASRTMDDKRARYGACPFHV